MLQLEKQSKVRCTPDAVCYYVYFDSYFRACKSLNTVTKALSCTNKFVGESKPADNLPRSNAVPIRQGP